MARTGDRHGPQGGDDRWAIDHGLEALETGNDEGNAGMRVNARLGYQPLPDEIFVRGPLLPPDSA